MKSFVKLGQLGWRLLSILCRNPARLSHVLGTALAASEAVAHRRLDLLRFRGVSPDELLPESSLDQRAALALFPKTQASLSVLELLCLILLLKKTGATSVFEFGTYQGVSITQLALNVPETGR